VQPDHRDFQSAAAAAIVARAAVAFVDRGVDMSMMLRKWGTGRLRPRAALFLILAAIVCKVEWAVAAAPAAASQARYQIELE
jgi:hypothetical protein